MRLENKVAIITGANSGVGAAAAKAFAKEGARVAVCARRAEALQAVAGEIKAAGGEILVVPTDISDNAQCVSLVEQVIAAFGKLDIVINNAGVLDSGLKGIASYSDAELENVCGINQRGTMQVIRAALPHMGKGGSIVNMASVAGVNGGGGAAYVCSKGAVIAITKHIALTMASAQIRCNAVCPGTILTPMTAGMDPASLDPVVMGSMMKHSDLSVPPCTAEDIAGILLFLASDESRAITGQILVTDYGSNL